MRTISYGIPILVVGVLAALPFRRVPNESMDAASTGKFNLAEPSVLMEVDAAHSHVWRPPPQVAAETPATAPHLPPLPTDYAHVAVPLETPPAISQRYSATGSAAVAPQLPVGPVQDAPNGLPAPNSVARGWQTNLAIGASRDEAESASLLAAPWPTSSQRDHERSADAVITTLRVSYPTSPDMPTAAVAEPTPRKRYYIREPGTR